MKKLFCIFLSFMMIFSLAHAANADISFVNKGVYLESNMDISAIYADSFACYIVQDNRLYVQPGQLGEDTSPSLAFEADGKILKIGADEKQVILLAVDYIYVLSRQNNSVLSKISLGSKTLKGQDIYELDIYEDTIYILTKMHDMHMTYYYNIYELSLDGRGFRIRICKKSR